MPAYEENFGYGEGPGKQFRRVYDCGPPRPVFVDEREPDKPDASLTGSEKAIAEADYEIDHAAWQQRRAAYVAAMRDWRAWHEANKAPLVLMVPFVDAKQMIAVDPDRYAYHWAHEPAPASNGPVAALAA